MVVSFLFRNKTELPDAADALPGRDTASLPRAREPLRARHAARAALPRGHRAGDRGNGLLLGRREGLLEAPGVYTTAVGYAAGYTPNPTYEEVCSGRTGHNEVVLVVFRPAEISFDDVLRLFWEGHDPPRACARATTWAPSTAPAST